MVHTVSSISDESCDPTYGKVDTVLELITKSKSLHILMVLDRAEDPLRFGDIKSRVEASSTTVSRRLKNWNTTAVRENLTQVCLVRYALRKTGSGWNVVQSLFDWAETWASVTTCSCFTLLPFREQWCRPLPQFHP